jgi:hypothetical protein
MLPQSFDELPMNTSEQRETFAALIRQHEPGHPAKIRELLELRDSIGMANTALGMTRSLEYTVQNLDEAAATITANISSTQKRIADLEEQTGQDFEYADKLARLIQRQQEITDALDLSKNQAPTQLGAELSDTTGEVMETEQTLSQVTKSGNSEARRRQVAGGIKT